MRMELVYLPDLPICAPAEIGVPGFSHICLRDGLEAAGRITARRHLVGQRFVVDKLAGARGPDGLVVKTLGVQMPTLDTRNLRGDQASTVREILGTLPGIRIEPPTMCRQCFQMRPMFVGWLGVTDRCAGERAIKLVFGPHDQNG